MAVATLSTRSRAAPTRQLSRSGCSVVGWEASAPATPAWMDLSPVRPARQAHAQGRASGTGSASEQLSSRLVAALCFQVLGYTHNLHVGQASDQGSQLAAVSAADSCQVGAAAGGHMHGVVALTTVDVRCTSSILVHVELGWAMFIV
jgi:hypothetical protein